MSTETDTETTEGTEGPVVNRNGLFVVEEPREGTEGTESPESQPRALGYLIYHENRAYAPEGISLECTRGEAETHNRILSESLVEGIRRELPERLAAYVREDDRALTLWDGTELGKVLWRGHWFRTLGYARRRWVRARVEGTDSEGRAQSATYGGYETDTRQLVYLRRLKS